MKKYLELIILNFIIFLSLLVYLDRRLNSYYNSYVSSLNIYYDKQVEAQKELQKEIKHYDRRLMEIKKEISKNFTPSDYSGKTVDELANEFIKRGF